MGVSTNGILAYGFDLGGGDGDWKIQEAGEYGEWTPEWANGEDTTVTCAEAKLLESVGFTETDWRADGYFNRQRNAEARVGVEFKSHCSDSCKMYVLAACTVTAHRGSAQEIDFAALEQQRLAEDWDGKLKRACEVLGITPNQSEPKWLLVSYWG